MKKLIFIILFLTTGFHCTLLFAADSDSDGFTDDVENTAGSDPNDAASTPWNIGAGLNEWEGNGPDGGNVLSVTIDPNNPDVAYAVIYNNGIFKTSDGGADWSNITTEIQPGPIASFFSFNPLIIDPADSDVIYFTTNYGAAIVYKSTDGGATWSSADYGLLSSVSYIVPDPSTADTLYAADSSGAVYLTTDGGDNWSSLGNITGGTNISGFAVAPSNNQVMYSWSTKGAYLSEDGGATWAPINNGLLGYSGGDPYVSAFAIDPADEDTAYAVVSNVGLYVTTDRGANWSQQDTTVSLPNDFFNSLVVDPDTTSTLFITSGNNEVLMSTDSGASWAASDTGLNQNESFNDISISPSNTDVLYTASNGTGVYRSTDHGATWSAAANGITGAEVRGLTLQPDSGNIFSSSRSVAHDDLISSSSNSGAEWDAASADFPASVRNGFSVAADPANSGTLYAGTSDKVFKSTNNGSTWTDTNVGVFGEYQTIIVNPQNTSIVYAMSTNENVLKTTDGGATWNPANNGLPNGGDPNANALALAPSAPDTLFLAGTSTGARGVSKTIDGGANWSDSNGGDMTSSTFVNAIAVNPDDADIVYAASSSSPPGIFKSTDGGATWTNIYSSNTYKLAIDPDHPDIVYAAGSSNILRTIDGGANWSTLPAPSRPRSPLALLVGPSGSHVIHAGFSGIGAMAMELATDLSIELSASDDPIAVGQDLTYTLTANNTGPMGAGAVNVTQTLPGDVTFKSATPSQGVCNESSGVVSCNLGPIESGNNATTDVVVTVNAVTTLTTNATVSSDDVTELYDTDNSVSLDVQSKSDYDGDGIPDDTDTDDDNDGWSDTDESACGTNSMDAASIPTDTDGDHICNVVDTDDDGDGVDDSVDAFPLDPTESLDTDNDGIGNNADTDDDNDGVPDTSDAFPLDPTESVDTDGDGVGDNSDNCIATPNSSQADSDGNGVGDACEPDDGFTTLLPVLKKALDQQNSSQQ